VRATENSRDSAKAKTIMNIRGPARSRASLGSRGRDENLGPGKTCSPGTFFEKPGRPNTAWGAGGLQDSRNNPGVCRSSRNRAKALARIGDRGMPAASSTTCIGLCERLPPQNSRRLPLGPHEGARTSKTGKEKAGTTRAPHCVSSGRGSFGIRRRFQELKGPTRLGGSRVELPGPKRGDPPESPAGSSTAPACRIAGPHPSQPT